MIEELDADIASIDAVLRRARQSPFWNFRSWNDRKRGKALAGMRRDLARDKDSIKTQLRMVSEELDGLLLPPKPRKVRSSKSHGRMETVDLFEQVPF